MTTLTPPSSLDLLREIEAKYTKIKPFTQGGGYWRSSFLRAATRIATWMKCLPTNARLDEWIAKEQPSSYEPEWLSMLPSVRYLLEAADPDTRLSPSHEFLLDLNTELLESENYRADSKKDNNEIMRTLYRLLREDRYALFAALALYDVHISDLDGVRATAGCDRRALDLVPNVFAVLAEGLNLWALRRRWMRIYIECTEREGLEKFAVEYRSKSADRERVARDLIAQFRQEFPHAAFSARIHQPTLANLYKNGFHESGVFDNIHLHITCADEKSCYAALCWFESQGPVERKYIRKSLFFAETNGARLLHTAVYYPTKDRLVNVRIGTAETQLNNEWGKLLLLVQNSKATLYEKHSGSALDSANSIYVYATNGTEYQIERNSTVADFISRTYSVEEAQHCTGAYINATPTTLGQTLAAEDVLRILIDPTHQNILALDKWAGNHLNAETKSIINSIRSKETDMADRGRNRILIEMQKYLRRWNISPAEKDLLPIFAAVGKKLTKSTRDTVYRNLAVDKSGDWEICQTALQYYLRGKILHANGAPLDIHWKDIKIANCCKPAPPDEIIGTLIEGPRDPANPRFGNKSLTVHQKNCRGGPAPQNMTRLSWAQLYREADNSYGLQASFLFEDDRGTLGELLDFIYSRTSLTLHFVHADAVNFGVKKAQIVLLATASTEEEIEEAINLLNTTSYRWTSKRLSVQETRVLLPSQEYCPYLLTIDPEMDKEVPIWITGRSRELSRLKTHINDPRVNRIMIVGYYRSGKTWFLKHFKSTHGLPGHYTVYLSFDIPPDKFASEYLVYDIYTRILAQLPPRRFDTSTAQRPRTLQSLSTWLQSVCDKNKCTINILIDEFSVMNEWITKKQIDPHFPGQFVRFMENTPCVNFVLVFQSAHLNNLIANEDSTDFIDYFRSRMGDEKIEIKPFVQAEMRDMLNVPVQDKYSVADDAVELSMRMTGGNPFLSAKLSRMLWEHWDLERYTSVDSQDLRRIFSESYIQDPDWNAFIARIIQKVPPVPLELLKFIARKQFEGWEGWLFTNDAWVDEEEIIREFNLPNSTPDVPDLLKKLVDVDFLFRDEADNRARLRIRSGLLAFKLADRKVYRNTVKAV